MHSATDEIHATPPVLKLNPQSGSLSASSLSESSLSESSPDRAVSVELKSARPLQPSDDPVLAELERTELEESQLESSIPGNSRPGKAAPLQPAAKSGAPAFPSYRQGRQKRRGPLVALLLLVLAGGGFYAVWTYQPGFRDLAQPQIDRVLALAGMALPPTSAPNPVKPSTQPAPATTSAPAPESPAAPNQTQSKAPDSAMSSATSSATGSPMASAVATPPAPPAATPSAAVRPPASAATAATAPVATKPEANKTSDKPADSKKNAAAATPSDTPLPGENSAIILSSKGAEKRLVQSVPPKYPVEARSAQGTVVLKAVVDANGKVEGLRLVEGNATLAAAAIQAVKQWRYRPYLRDGKAQAFQTIVIVDFQRP
jgi:protein TonB